VEEYQTLLVAGGSTVVAIVIIAMLVTLVRRRRQARADEAPLPLIPFSSGRSTIGPGRPENVVTPLRTTSSTFATPQTPATMAPGENGGARERALLALLVLSVNHVVSTDRLVQGLWGERAGDGALHALRVHISRLRKLLREAGGDGVLLTMQGQPSVEWHRALFSALDMDLLESGHCQSLAAMNLQVFVLHMLIPEPNSGFESRQIDLNHAAYGTGLVGDGQVTDDRVGLRLEAAADGQRTHDPHPCRRNPIGVAGRERPSGGTRGGQSEPNQHGRYCFWSLAICFLLLQRARYRQNSREMITGSQRHLGHH